jgi:IS5 family transposase
VNRHKEGRKFLFPPCFIQYLSLLQTYLGTSCRSLESMVSFLAGHMPLLKRIDHSTIHRRIASLGLDLGKSIHHRRSLTVSIDSSGLKVHNRGDWIRHKHKVRRGYLKIHFAVNTKTREIIGLESTRENVNDNRKFRPMVRKLLKKYSIKKLLADAAYDDHRNFNLLDRHGVIPAIKLKRNSRKYAYWPRRDKNHRVRRKYAALMLKSYDDWKRRLGYGKRWISEIVFSSFKANFGEYFHAKLMENIVKEIERKAYVHNMLANHLIQCQQM